MIAPGLLLAASLAGAAYTLTPGPGFLMLLGIGAAQGRPSGAAFIFGHFAGDVVWSGMALVAILGARQIGDTVFDGLGLICGAYLARLGWMAVTAARRSDNAPVLAVRHPWRRGVIFGLTNPKGYPVAVATFTALLASQADRLGWGAFVPLLLAGSAGSLAGDLVLVAIVGASSVRRFYRRHEVWIVRGSGALFLGFAAAALRGAVPGLLASLAP